MRFEARRGEIHECADLRNGKPTLWGNEVQRHRGVLVVGEKDLQLAFRKLFSNVIREKSGDAASFHGRGDAATTRRTSPNRIATCVESVKWAIRKAISMPLSIRLTGLSSKSNLTETVG